MSENGNDQDRTVIGQDMKLPTTTGKNRKYVNLDNAATTPALKYVQHKVTEFLKYYASVGRGTGFKSRVSTLAVDEARNIIADFVGADQDYHTVIFTKHATEAINKISRRLPFSKQDVIISTWLEHHANLLPWRKLQKEKGTKVVHAKIHSEDGTLNVRDLLDKIDRYQDRLKLVTVTGASNVTGYIPPLKEIAGAVHKAGGSLLVDAAQLAPHKPIKMGKPDSPKRIDFLAFSGHKMYAPFGTGVLIGPEQIFEVGEPEQQGGGAVNLVSQDFTLWRSPPAKEETGTPNAVGIIAMAAAADKLTSTGMEKIGAHEDALTQQAMKTLTEIDGLTIFGPNDDTDQERLGIFTFKLNGLHHNLVAAILSYEYGIATRSGCFCAHPYLLEMIGVSHRQIDNVRKEVSSGKKANLAGAVRASLGIYNTTDDINKLVSALTDITENKRKYEKLYRQDEYTGEFYPKKVLPDYRQHFSLCE